MSSYLSALPLRSWRLAPSTGWCGTKTADRTSKRPPLPNERSSMISPRRWASRCIQNATTPRRCTSRAIKSTGDCCALAPRTFDREFPSPYPLCDRGSITSAILLSSVGHDRGQNRLRCRDDFREVPRSSIYVMKHLSTILLARRCAFFSCLLQTPAQKIASSAMMRTACSTSGSASKRAERHPSFFPE